MKILTTLILVLIVSLRTQPLHAQDEPTTGLLHAYKVYHHAEYMKTTAQQAGGTNNLLHTKKLPTEGSDPVVTPALDHLYSKAVIDLTHGPVILDVPIVAKDRYFSIMITDQEHYVIYDEIRPSGTYIFVRKGWKGEIPEGKRIDSPSTYPHLFVRTQVKTADDLPNTLAIQEKLKLTGNVGELAYENAIKFTIATHDVYEQNKGILETELNYSAADHEKMTKWAGDYFAKHVIDNTGMFGPIDSKEKGSNNPKVRAAAIIGHLGLPVHHAYYTGIFNNDKGHPLNGSNPYTVTLPYESNVREFWSITRYSALTRNTLPGKNDVYNAYNTKPDKDGLVRITFSVEDPKDGTYWMPVNEREPYYYVERFYSPKGKVKTTLDYFSAKSK